MGQVLYSKFNATIWLKSLFPKDLYQNYYGKGIIQKFGVYCNKNMLLVLQRKYECSMVLKSAPRKVQVIAALFGNPGEIPALPVNLEME